MTSPVEKAIADLGLEFPPVPEPVAAYVPAVRVGNLVFTAGQLPRREGPLMISGRVGVEVRIEKAAEAARLCALNALAAIKGQIGDLSRIRRIVKLVVFVASPGDFTAHAKVANGASEFLLQVFGEKIGAHARSAVGTSSLPMNAPVELEMIVEVED